MTFCEKIMWMHLRRKQLGYRFLRQYSIDQFVIDFYCPELKLAIELDGSIHDEPDQKEYDKHRQEYLEKFGVRFVRITNDELMSNVNMVFKKIEEEIKKLLINLTKPFKIKISYVGEYIGVGLVKGLGLNLVTKCNFNFYSKLKTIKTKTQHTPFHSPLERGKESVC